MARRWQKAFWALLAGASLVMGACDDDSQDSSQDAYGVPVDVIEDDEGAEEDVGEDVPVDPEEEEAAQTDYGPPPSP